MQVSPPRLTVSSSRLVTGVMLLGSLVFVALGILILADGRADGRVAGWSCLGFSALCTLAFAVQLFEQRPRLVFDDVGVLDHSLGVGVIPWVEIDDACLVTIAGNHFLYLYLRDPQPWVAKLGRVARAMAAGSEKLGLTPFCLSLTAIDDDPRAIHAYVVTMAAASRGGGHRVTRS